MYGVVEWQINISRTVSVLVIRVLVDSPFSHLMWLLAQESFTEFSRPKSFQSYIKSMVFGYKKYNVHADI